VFKIFEKYLCIKKEGKFMTNKKAQYFRNISVEFMKALLSTLCILLYLIFLRKIKPENPTFCKMIFNAENQ